MTDLEKRLRLCPDDDLFSSHRAVYKLTNEAADTLAAVREELHNCHRTNGEMGYVWTQLVAVREWAEDNVSLPDNGHAASAMQVLAILDREEQR